MCAPAACSAPAKAVTEFALPEANSLPHLMAKGADGALWFTEQTGHRIGRIATEGTITEFALPQAGNPIGIAAGPDGNMWFTEAPGDRIGRIDPHGTISEFAAGLSAGSSTGSITAGPDGGLWFTEDSGKLGRISTSGTIAEYALPDATGVMALDGIASDRGHIWFTLGFPKNAIGRMSIDTRQIKEFALPEGSSIPQGITCGPDGKMWFTLPNSHRIGSIDAVGKITEFELPDNGGDPGGPSEIALGPDKSLWFTEFNNDRIGKIDTAGTITELVARRTASQWARMEISGSPSTTGIESEG